MGVNQLLSGEREKGRKNLRCVQRSGNKNFIEYDLAVTQLAYLDK